MLPPDDLEKASDLEIVFEQPEMFRRQITLADGRYLYFYTFSYEADSPERIEGLDVPLEES